MKSTYLVIQKLVNSTFATEPPSVNVLLSPLLDQPVQAALFSFGRLAMPVGEETMLAFRSAL